MGKKAKSAGPARSARTPEWTSNPLNRRLSDAKRDKQDEFYAQYIDIQKEVEAYLEFDSNTFKGKIVYVTESEGLHR